MLQVLKKIIRFTLLRRKLNKAYHLQKQLAVSYLNKPNLIKQIFPDELEHKRKVVLLTNTKDLAGRKFFVESLNAEIVDKVSELHQDTVFICFGYSDFLKNVTTLKKINKPKLIFLEAAYLRGILMDNTGSIFDQAWCFFADDLGFHYDPNIPSRLELLLNSDFEIDESQFSRAKNFQQRLLSNFITKYNNQPIPQQKDERRKHRVLVVEQALNDWAILKSGGSRKSFQYMLRTALEQNPDSEIWIKLHPDTIDNKRGGINNSYFGRHTSNSRIQVVQNKVNPIAMLSQVDKVYVFSSMLGFEALMLGKEVHLFGKPLYGGWGQTIDYGSYPSRTKIRTLEELIYAIYFMYTVYKNENGRWCEPEEYLTNIITLRNRYLQEQSDIKND